MSNPGLGVMIQALGGSRGDIEKFKRCMGKVIQGFEHDDESLTIKFRKENLVVKDDGQSCCEHRYITIDDNLDDFIGAKFENIIEKELKEVDDDGEYHEMMFVDIKTSKGNIQLVTHNEHNGYYGGFWLVVK